MFGNHLFESRNENQDRNSNLDISNQKIAQIENEYIASVREIAEIYESEENWQKLIECYKQLIAISPQETDTYFKLAQLYKDQGKHYRAIATYQDLVELAPDSLTDVYQELADLLSQNQDSIQEALEIYQKAGTIEQNWSPQFCAKLADFSLKASHYEAAIDYARKAIELKSDVPHYYILLGNALFGTEVFDEAIKSFTKAIQIKPDNFYAYRRIGDALVETNELTTAARFYLKVLDLNPKATHIYRLLGDIFNKQGKTTEAQHYYQKANA